jgi:AcrR family transcriptional regulator
MLISEHAHVGLREQARQDKRRRILAAGRTLFARDGFDATTTRAIAQQASIGTGTLFLYFAEKRGLLLQLFMEDVEPVHRAATAAVDPDAALLDALAGVFRTLFDYYARDLRLSRVFLSELAFLDASRRDELMSFTLEFLHALAVLVERAQARGLVRPEVAPRRAASALFRVYYAVLIQWIGGGSPSPAAAEAELRDTLSLLLDGLAGGDARSA